MLGRTHTTAGVLAGTVLFGISTVIFKSNLKTEEDLTIIMMVYGVPGTIGAVMGSKFPDIDHPESKINRGIIGIFTSLLQLILYYFASLLPDKQEETARKLLGHRGITHSFFMCVLISYIFFVAHGVVPKKWSVVYIFFAVGFVLGMLTHLLLDIFTVQGICIFSPFWNEKISLGSIKTGKKTERRIHFLLIMLIIFCFFGILGLNCYYMVIKKMGL